MKRTIALLTLLGLVGTASASTIAYWRFEDGTAGTEHPGDKDDWYVDSSGNGNHLSSWWDESRPMATTVRPFTTVPQTGAANNLALDFDNGTGGTEGLDDLGTFGNGGGKMIDTYSFVNGWTMEATFKARDIDHWQVVLGKDGKPGAGAEQTFSFKLAPSAESFGIRCLVIKNDLNFDFIDTVDIMADEWYSIAATYDNSEFKVFLKGESDADYVLQGSLTRTEGIMLGNASFGGTWTVGRGMWDSNPSDFFNGEIDEVRISDTALDPSEFIAIPEPGTLGLFGLLGGAMLWIRKRSRN